MPREIGRRASNPDATYDKSFTEGAAEGRVRVTKEGATNIGSGWSSDRRTPQIKSGDKIKRFSVDEGEEVLMHFVEDSPFVSYWQHWINKKPSTCLIDNCPLCNIGDTPKPVECFNVIRMGENGPELFAWQMSAEPTKKVKARAENKRTAPLNKIDLYFAVSKKKASTGFFEYSVDPVKADELKDEWGVEILTDESLAELAKDAYTADIAQVQARHELQELADSLKD
jgi:hypothetical protein